MAQKLVYLRWHEGDDPAVYSAVHASLEGALEQAAAEPNKKFLGVFDGSGEDAKKLATVKGASNG